MPTIFRLPKFFTPPIPQNLTFKEVALDEKQPYMYRVKAINGLGLGCDVKAAEVLYQCLNDTSPGIRGWAAQNLGYLAFDLDEHTSKEIKHVLSLALLKKEEDIKVKESIQQAITFINENSNLKKEHTQILYTANSKFPFPNPFNLQHINKVVIQDYTNPEIAELRMLLDLAQKNKDSRLDKFNLILLSEGLSDYEDKFSNDASYRENIRALINKSFKDDEKKLLYEILKLNQNV